MLSSISRYSFDYEVIPVKPASMLYYLFAKIALVRNRLLANLPCHRKQQLHIKEKVSLRNVFSQNWSKQNLLLISEAN